MFGIFKTIVGLNLAESIIDNAIRDRVLSPEIGSIVYCDLAFGTAEHSGIYVGGNEIIHLNRHGWVECVSPEEFIAGTTGMSIYTSCRNGRPIGDEVVADRARRFEQRQKDYKGYYKEYSLLTNNCHIFSSSCVSGDMDNADTFLWMLKHSAEKELGANEWRVWDTKPKFGALAISKSTGEYFYSWGAESKFEAEKMAMKNASADAKVICSAGGSKWIALAMNAEYYGCDSDFSKKHACEKAKKVLGDSSAPVVLCFSAEDGFIFQPG